MHANWLRLHFDMFFMTADFTIKKQVEKISLISIITQIIQKIQLHYLGYNVDVVKLLGFCSVRFFQIH